MIRLLLAALLAVPSFVLSRPLLAAGDSGRAEIAFSQGLIAYRNEKYAAAESAFSKAVALDASHQPAAHFLGMSLYQQKKYAEAVTAFDAATRLDETQAEPFFYRGLSCYHMGRPENAGADFEKTAVLAAEGPLYDLARSYLRALEERKDDGKSESDKPWFVYAGVSAQYDSNASLNPDNLTLTTLPADQSDFQFAAQVGGGYQFFKDRPFSLMTQASYYQSIYARLQSFDYGLARAEASPSWVTPVGNGKLYLKAPVAYEFSTLDHSKYLSSIQAFPSIGHLWGTRLFTRLQSKFKLDSFFQTGAAAAQDRDAKNLELELSETVFFDGRKRTVRIAYIFENNWADGADWDYRGHGASFSLYNPLIWGVDLEIHGSFTFDKRFSNVDSILGSRRVDKIQSGGASFSKKIVNHLKARIQYDFLRNDSNLALFSYQKHLTGVTFEADF